MTTTAPTATQILREVAAGHITHSVNAGWVHAGQPLPATHPLAVGLEQAANCGQLSLADYSQVELSTTGINTLNQENQS